MKLGAIYEFVIKKGLEKDPRTKNELKSALNRIKREYRVLKAEDKKHFDKERIRHPYADTRILYGDRGQTVRTIMVGIDIEAPELLTAHLLNDKDAGIDLVMSHHPSGIALVDLPQVMHVQTDILHRMGINLDVAKSLMKERIDETSRNLLPRNHQRSVDVAKLLNIPFMCVHTPADNHVVHFLQKLFETKKPGRVSDALRILKTIPEYRDAMFKAVGPRLIAGKESNKSGKVFVDMTGGTEGSKKVFARLSQAGIGTIVAMHLSEEHFKIAKSEFINIIIAGHIASDNLGLNLLLDELTKKDAFNIIPCSGFVRVKR
ncbi:MAG: NGG1p interacting factor NIF3 [Omnitrophica bacterium RBG_13_46_9]|nr:MAG: NGG1p interacting factor NIF3 [Omnitrophica bacterium RBG_13_46_9]